MSLLDQLPKPQIKKDPAIWVKRMVILGQLKPKPAVIRDIHLRRGLNIVWAEEPESTADKSDIAGHSAGKTTFCRLVRYVLGETTFGNQAGMRAIGASFPNGYVAAEIMNDGVQWAVLRPLGDNRNSWILQGGTVEDVLDQKGEPAFQDSYTTKIGLSRQVEGLSSATVVRTREEIKWAHVLAWCSRDQEARFQNVHEWRSPRSESAWPTFRFPKADPLFVMRVVLGLYLPDELGTEETLSLNQRKLEEAEALLESLKREPDFWRQHYDSRVRKNLIARLPADAEAIAQAPIASSELLPDLKRYVDKAKFLIQDSIEQLEKGAATLQRGLDQLHESVAQTRNDLVQIDALFELGEKATQEIQAGLNATDEFHQKTAEHRERMCPFGDVLIGECSHVKDRRNRLLPGELKAAHTLEQVEAQRAAERQKLLKQQQEMQARLAQTQQKRDRETERQREIAAQLQALATARTTFDSDYAELLDWENRVRNPEKTAKLKTVAEKITALREVIESERETLNTLLANHDSNRDLLNQIFSSAAREVLPSSNYDGVVNFENRELNFQITHGGAMSGEAMETLAVLLADISCLIFNLLSAESHLPGFLLHDSPREADLGLRLYHSFITFTAKLEKALSRKGECPFQYILTTTTPPPDAVAGDRYVVLRLDASREKELLFRRNLARPLESEQLQLPT